MKCSHKKVEQFGENYTILSHTFSNGDTWTRCMRCGQTWKSDKEWADFQKTLPEEEHTGSLIIAIPEITNGRKFR